ncbi:unnamed protein product [Acanthosepion pharaonis]|uniref:Uncharacterized protein n=1 Tax=Acanthosepion pharaonis TaxID=158019 RepID=A0A812DIB7_ACAPH|nr:unnamed protein product [Sepia pharaonis]
MGRCADPSTQPRLRLPLLHQLCKFVPISSCHFCQFASISDPQNLPVVVCLSFTNSVHIRLSVQPTLSICVYLYLANSALLCLSVSSRLPTSVSIFFNLGYQLSSFVSISTAPPCLFASISAPTPLPVFRLSCPPTISVFVNLCTEKFELISSTPPISDPKRLFTSIYIRQQYPIPPISATLHLSVYVYICPSTSPSVPACVNIYPRNSAGLHLSLSRQLSPFASISTQPKMILRMFAPVSDPYLCPFASVDIRFCLSLSAKSIQPSPFLLRQQNLFSSISVVPTLSAFVYPCPTASVHLCLTLPRHQCLFASLASIYAPQPLPDCTANSACFRQSLHRQLWRLSLPYKRYPFTPIFVSPTSLTSHIYPFSSITSLSTIPVCVNLFPVNSVRLRLFLPVHIFPISIYYFPATCVRLSCLHSLYRFISAPPHTSVRVYLFTVNATSLHLFMLHNLCQIAPLNLPCQQCHFLSESLLPSQPVCVYHFSTIFTGLRPSPSHQPCPFASIFSTTSVHMSIFPPLTIHMVPTSVLLHFPICACLCFTNTARLHLTLPRHICVYFCRFASVRFRLSLPCHLCLFVSNSAPNYIYPANIACFRLYPFVYLHPANSIHYLCLDKAPITSPPTVLVCVYLYRATSDRLSLTRHLYPCAFISVQLILFVCVYLCPAKMPMGVYFCSSISINWRLSLPHQLCPYASISAPPTIPVLVYQYTICTCTSISVRQLYPFAQSLPPFALPVAHAPPLFASLYLTFVSVCATPDSAYLCFAITDLPTNHFCAFSTPPKGICSITTLLIYIYLSLARSVRSCLSLFRHFYLYTSISDLPPLRRLSLPRLCPSMLCHFCHFPSEMPVCFYLYPVPSARLRLSLLHQRSLFSSISGPPPMVVYVHIYLARLRLTHCAATSAPDLPLDLSLSNAHVPFASIYAAPRLLDFTAPPSLPV